MDKEWIDQIEIYPIDSDTVQKIDWALVLGGAALTILCVVAFLYWLYKLIIHLWAANSGKAAIVDQKFWFRMLIALILIMALMSGVWLTVIDQFFGELNRVLKGWKM